MAEGLSRRGHDVHVVTYHLGEDPPDATFEIHRIARIPTYSKTSAGPSYQKLAVLDPLLAFELRRLLRVHRFDVIHAHHFEGLLVADLARSKRAPPIVFDAHTLLESELPYYGLGLPRGVKRALGRRLDRWFPGRAEHVIAVTDDIRSRLIESGAAAAESVSVIPNGVESDVFAAPRPPRLRNGQPRRLIFTGNLAPYQGIDFMLDAFRVLRQQRDDVRLTIATEDSFTPYEQTAIDMGIRSFIDVHEVDFSRVPELLGEAEIALNPRVDCDGLPQKLLNYMAAGRPVVSFAGSAKHLTDGRHGTVVEDRDVEGFARAIDDLLSDSAWAHGLGTAGRTMVRNELSWEATAARVEALYHRVV
ncbi:MAG: glycosyltransferase family 4 protein [Gemmatimonadetes bacterium]|nr:glycosyltransferase family 4 protein [Gemmatimonadota bacterium]